MFPLLAIGGAIGAVVSVIQGASWLSDQLDSSKATTSVGGKGGATAQVDAKVDAKTAPDMSRFEAALAAQAAGQTVPSSSETAVAAASPAPSSFVATLRGTDYDTLARLQAGIAAYGHVGERRGAPGEAADQPVRNPSSLFATSEPRGGA